MRPKLKTTLYWSLGGHAGVLILFLLISLISSCKRNKPQEEIYILELSDGPPAPVITTSQPTTAPPVQDPKPQPQPPGPEPIQPPVEESEPAPEQKPDIKPDPTPEPPRETVSFEEFQRQNNTTPQPQERQPEVVQPPQNDPTPSIREGIEEILTGFEGMSSNTTESEKYKAYVNRLRAQINRLWAQPKGLPPGKWTAMIEFYVNSNGTVTNLRFRERSGNTDFDQSLIRAMNAFKTTAPPPGGKTQSFTIPFSMTVR